MTISYTADQLTRETQLLVSELALLANLVIDDAAGIRALKLEPDSHFDQIGHPDDLSEVHDMAIWEHISRIERYVRDQQWDNRLSTDIQSLALAVERIFSPIVLEGYAMERANHPQYTDVPPAHEEGAGDVPFGFFHHGILANLVAQATARLKVDRNERLTMAEVALLLDVREPTVITNAHRKNFPTVEDENRRLAEPADVLPWMEKQGYLPTRMPAKKGTKATAKPSSADDDAVVFVPVARDGTWFSPECRSGGRYTIGEKGAEAKHTDYFAALEALQKMNPPRWRRKNSDGIPGIVAGVRFDRQRRADIERLLK